MKLPTYQVLSKSELYDIDAATKRVLENTGVLVETQEARDIFRKAGCTVDEKTMNVKIPEELVDWSVSVCPSVVTTYSRGDDRSKDLVSRADGTKTNYITFGTGTRMSHYLGNGKYDVRPSCLEDIGHIAKMVDGLDNIDCILGPVTAMDYIEDGRHLREVDIMMRNTSKPLIPESEYEYLDLYYEYVKAVYGGDEEMAWKRPFISNVTCPASPLQLNVPLCEIMIHSADYGAPVIPLSMAMSGATSPIDIAGTLVTHNAEVLASIVLVQLANPKWPTIYGSSTTAFDLFNTVASVGSPELGLISAGVTSLAQYYGLPCVVAGL